MKIKMCLKEVFECLLSDTFCVLVDYDDDVINEYNNYEVGDYLDLKIIDEPDSELIELASAFCEEKLQEYYLDYGRVIPVVDNTIDNNVLCLVFKKFEDR